MAANTPLTYLQLVNRVLLSLREAQVSDLSSPYAQLIGEFINEAKEKVEAAWRWKALATSLTFTTVSNQTAYPLTSAASMPIITSNTGAFPSGAAEVLTNENGEWQAFDTTTAPAGGLIRLQRTSREDELTKNLFMASQSPVQPNKFSYAHENGVPVFTLVGNPTVGRSLLVRMKVPQPTLATVTDLLLVPSRPVTDFASFLACEERGEELSEKSAMWLDRHNQSLERAIENDLSGEPGYMQLRNPDMNQTSFSLSGGQY